MNKLKDFFYNKNDILIALIILAVAAFVILWRVDAILSYPETLVANAGTQVDNQLPPDVSNDEALTGSGITTDPDTTTDSAVQPPQQEVEICGIYVNYGESLDVVAQNCVAAGLIGSTEEFMTVVNQLDAAQKIQAGQHHIPSNVTPEQLVEYLIKPGL